MQVDNPAPKRKLIDIVRMYQVLLGRVEGYLRGDIEQTDIANYLGLSVSNYYSKRQGTKRFTYDEVKLLLERFGSEEEKEQYAEFIAIRDGLYSRLLETNIPLAQYRRLINLQHHKNLARRRDHPDTWKVGDMETIGLYMESVAHYID